MELFLFVVLNTLIILAAFYLIVLIISICFVWSFSSISARHNHDLAVILANKRDLLNNLVSLLTGSGVKLDKKKIDLLANFDLKRVDNLQKDEAKLAIDELTSINDYLLGVLNNNEKVSNLEESFKLNKNLEELDKVYRQHLLMYNADVLGFNFWINFWPTRFIFKLFKLKRKSNI